jgi:hypothetical protein
MSAASPSPESLNEKTEAVGPVSEPSRPTQPWFHPPPVRDALRDLDLDEENFDFHDTIPAPPWFDEAPRAEVPAP